MAKRLQKRKGSQVTASSVAELFLKSEWASTWRFWLPRFLLIVGATLWIYWPAFRSGFVWDDAWYITTNPLLHNGTGLWKFWFQPGSWVEYYPVEETILWIQWQLWGNTPPGYHLSSVVLHVVNALLVWRLLGKFGLRLAWVGGLVFAVHPVQVESVAWISEIKNTLSLPFFLLAMSFWIDYEEHKRRRDYRWALGLFLIAMLCKITVSPFPLIILVYAWWKRDRMEWSDLKASAPFFAISLVLGYMTIWVGQRYEEIGHSQPDIIPLGGFFSRLAGAGHILSFYFSRSLLPLDYLPCYPQWSLNALSPVDYWPWLLVLAGFYGLWKKRRSWGRHALLGLGFFVLFLAPFLGFIPVSYMSFTWVMDHLLYIPVIGLIGLAVAALGDLEARFPSSRLPATVGVMVVAALMAWESRSFANFFVSDETLWSHTLQLYPNAWLAHYDLGTDLTEQGRYDEALAHLKMASALQPADAGGHYNLGLALDKLGRTGEAQDQYREALRLNPNDLKAYLNLGELMRRNGNLVKAESLMRQGLKIDPDDVSLCTDLGGLLFQTGRVSEAIDLYEHAVEISPDFAQLQYDLGVALLQTGSLSDAAEHLNAAVMLDPKIISAHENLGVVLARLGHLPEAIEQFEAVLALDPHAAQARDNLALALAQTGRVPEAMDQFRQALQINPNDAAARENLAKLQQFEMQQNGPGKN
ncbi:MAG: tetratricopeptide repeat protein [Methylacidiphilales bacterium]|nr:tetratricopeptide repeat protein [Candidatus Methylacidiphilales bacterium]